MEDTKTCLEKQPLSQEMLEKMNAYWRAANYLDQSDDQNNQK